MNILYSMNWGCLVLIIIAICLVLLYFERVLVSLDTRIDVKTTGKDIFLLFKIIFNKILAVQRNDEMQT
jgi:hypothetical protein